MVMRLDPYLGNAQIALESALRKLQHTATRDQVEEDVRDAIQNLNKVETIADEYRRAIKEIKVARVNFGREELIHPIPVPGRLISVPSKSLSLSVTTKKAWMRGTITKEEALEEIRYDRKSRGWEYSEEVCQSVLDGWPEPMGRDK